MKRPPASVVVVAAAGPDGAQRADLVTRLLRPSLGVRDEVVVVADGSPAAARLWPTATVADRRRAGLLAATHEHVVLVCADSVPPRHALDPLVAAVAAGAAGAGPRNDVGAGRQQVCPPLWALQSQQTMRAWSTGWQQEHRGERAAVPALGDGVLAARRAHLLDDCAPGVGERLADRGELVLVGDAVWHHRGAAGCGLAPVRRPLLSAVLIVKDEQDSLGECLAALRGRCDEVVVYDTGSTDGTVALARSAGARVVTGYWDDHFGDARNRALAHATGEWVVQVDADEVLDVADLDGLRRLLRSTPAEALAVDIESRTEAGHGTPHVAATRRLARRDEAWYAGRIHEQVLHREGRVPRTGYLPDVRIVHYGYLAARAAARGKSGRNLHLAELAVRDEVPPGLTRGEVLANLARSQKFAGRDAAVLGTAAAAWTEDHSDVSRRDLAATAAWAAASLGRFDEAHRWLDRLAAASGSPARVREVRVMVLVLEGRPEEALQVLAEMPEQAEADDGRLVRRAASLGYEVTALLALGRTTEATEAVLAATAAGAMNLPLARTVAVLAATGSGLAAYARALPERLLLPALAEVASLPAGPADDLLEQLWVAARRPAAVLAAATGVATGLPVLRALEWSARLRGHGAAEVCPLVAVAGAADRPVRDRVVAAAVALESFADERALPLFLTAAGEVPEEQVDAVTAELQALAPGVVSRLLVA